MASDDDIERLKAQNFGEPIKHDDEVGPVGNLFGSCVQILQALSTKARELDAASRKNYHPDGLQRSESANESSSAQSRKEGRVRKMAKSGCVTCRKRKKMCDEGKPECNKCVRDGFICDGYIVKSTRQKPEAPNSNSSGQGTETFPKSGQPLPLVGAASQLLVKTLESNLATLIFWDDEFGALSGHLDKALEHSEENRDLTLVTLISLADFLSHDLLNATLPLPVYRDDIRQKSNIHAQVDKARGIIMDTETPDREETRDIQDVCEILDSKVARLNVLGPILEESIPSGAAFEQVAAHGQLDDRPAHQYYADQISIRFPNASASLVEVLGKCNWERYMRIHQKREENTQREGSPIGETENMSKFHDSGLGTSVPAQSAFGVPRGSFVYAETEVSKRAEASHRRLPPLPEEGRRGWPFVCDVCNSLVRIRRTGAWKKHVFSDVLAYVCIFDDCPSDRCFFEDRDALTAHLGNQHGFAPTWKSAICPLCLEETGNGMNAISLHFIRHMEEVALGAIPRTAESDAGSDESSSVASSENSRSNSFYLVGESTEKGMCPVEGCGRVFKDLKVHMLTHTCERPEKCPITTCEYHLKGFARKYDKNRHILTHYKQTMVCGFCPSSGSMAEKSFNRVDVFKRHLTTVHGVEQTPPNSRKKNAAAKKVYNSIKTAGNCSICSVTFANAQDFYEHLNDCVLNVGQKASEPAEYTYPGPTDPAAESASPFLQPIKIGSTPPPYPPPLPPQHSAPVISQTGSPTTFSSRRRRRENRTRPSQGDTVLLGVLDPERPDIVRAAGERALNSDSDPEPSDSEEDTPGSPMQTNNETTPTVLPAEATPKRLSSGKHSITSKPKLAPLGAIAEPKPEPRKTRTWTDRTGSFKVEAEFMGLKDGKINLHKLNGVDITVSIPKMSVEDLEYVEKVTGVSLDKEKALELVFEDRKEPFPSPQTHAVHQLSPSASFAPVSHPFPDGQPVADAPQPDEEPTSEITKCACGYRTGDGTNVQCEVCKTWQHVLCYYDDEEQIPQNHVCVACQPRTIDWARIKESQKVFKNMTYMSERESKPPGLKSPKNKQKDLAAAIAPVNENASPASEGRDSSNDDSATQPSRGGESIHSSSGHPMPGLDLNNVEYYG